MSELSAYNPRFPHSLTVKRIRLDAEGNPVVDAEGNPVYDTILTSAFGYRNQNATKTGGEVVENTEKLALPRTLVRIDTNDILEITDYTGSYKALVVKARTYNFGTNIWMRNPHN